MIKILKKFNDIRQPKSNISLFRKILSPVILIIIGGFLGVIFKYFDTTPFWEVIPHCLSEFLADLGTLLSFWVLTTTLIACYSRSPLAAGIHSFCYLFSMVITYYIYQAKLFKYFSKRYFILWSIASALSFFCGYFVWYALGNGKFAVFCSTLPPTIILQEAITLIIFEMLNFHRLVGSHIIMLVFCILSTILLLIILPSNKKQRMWSLIFTLISAPVISVIFTVVYKKLF